MPSVTVLVTSPVNALIPTVSVGVPKSLGACSDLKVDLSSSKGGGGRVWRSVVWSVAAGVGDPAAITAYLYAQYDIMTNTVIIPKDLLLPTAYSFTVKLTNFLNASASATATASIVGDVNLPIVSILGPTLVTTKSISVLTLSASAALTPCSQSSELKYYWTLRDPLDATKKVLSASVDPQKFQIASYALFSGTTYELTVRVDVMKDKTVLSSATTAPTEIYVASGSVVALIKGAQIRQNPVDRVLVIDASLTYDENSPTTVLSYQWSCTIATTGADYGTPCSFTAKYLSTATTNTLTLPPMVLPKEGETYSFRVTASSPRGRTGSTVVEVKAAPAGAPVVSSNGKAVKFNSDVKLNVFAYITADFTTVGAWTASYAGQPVPLTTAVTPITKTFAADQVKATAVYPIAFPQNTFTAGRTYAFMLTASPVKDLTITSSVEILLVCNSFPTGGYVVITPPTGFALSTNFKFSASGWVDDAEDFPLTFDFSYSRVVSNLVPPLSIKGLSVLPYATSQLPEGLASQNKSIKIINRACDAYFACASADTKVTVQVNASVSPLAGLGGSLQSSLASGNADATFTAINLASSSISAVNCTGTPPSFCAALHRELCLEAGTANTCGSCKTGFRGMVGDGNVLCVNASLPIGALGASCTQNKGCLYNLCTAGRCAAPTLRCPSNTDAVCTGRGTCKLADLSGNTLQSCTIVDTSCTASCQCEEGYGGIDCSFTPKELAARTAARTDMCDALTKVIVKQDKSSLLLDVIVTALLSSYEVSTGSCACVFIFTCICTSVFLHLCTSAPVNAIELSAD